MIKKHEKFFYGITPVEYSELIAEFSDTLKKKIYSPQYEKISGVIRLIEDRDFEYVKQFKDKILINTIMVTQIARYYWMMGNFEIGTRGYENQYRKILDICQAVYPKVWNSNNDGIDDLETYFREFTRSKVLKDSFYFPKRDFWYSGRYDAWQFGYAKDVKCLKKNGYANSELWSLDWTVMQWLAIRMEAFIKDYEADKFMIIISKKELTKFKETLKFVKAYAEQGSFCYYEKELGLVDNEGKVTEEQINNLWIEFGQCLPRMWW